MHIIGHELITPTGSQSSSTSFAPAYQEANTNQNHNTLSNKFKKDKRTIKWVKSIPFASYYELIQDLELMLSDSKRFRNAILEIDQSGALIEHKGIM